MIKLPKASAYSFDSAGLGNGFARTAVRQMHSAGRLVEATAPELLTPVCHDQSRGKDAGFMRSAHYLSELPAEVHGQSGHGHVRDYP